MRAGGISLLLAAILIVLAASVATTTASIEAARSAGSIASSPAAYGEISYETVMAGCADSCFEPTIAVGPNGEMYATSTGNKIMRSFDGGETWVSIPSPPPPATAPPDGRRGDQILAVGLDGEVHYAALVFEHRSDQGAYVFIPLGIHVATSYDAGGSWDDANHFVSPAGGPYAPGLPADRPWFAIGPAGEIYLSYRAMMGPSANVQAFGERAWGFAEAGVWVSRSSDAGLSWDIPKHAYGGGAGTLVHGSSADYGITTNGQVVVDRTGNVYVASFARERTSSPLGPLPTGDRGLVVAKSTDGGWSFTTHVVESTGPSEPGSWAPSLTVGAHGELFVAAKDIDGWVRVFVSHDSALTWSGGNTWNEAPADWGVFALAGPRGLDVLWYEPEGNGGAILRGARDADPVDGVELARLTLSEPLVAVDWSTDAFTDFAFAARAPSGGLAAVWADFDPGDVYLTIES